jgi:hypothetical protein
VSTQEAAKTVLDVAAAGTTAGLVTIWLAGITGWLTAIAALLTIVYTSLRIYGWFTNRREE